MSRLTRKEKEEAEALSEVERVLKEKRRKEEFNRFTGGIAILFIMSIFPYVYFFQYIDFCFHKDQVQVGEVRMVEQGWSDSLEEYAITFHVDMEFGKYEAYVVSFHTLIYKDGEFIGYLTSDLKGPVLKEEDGSRSHVFETNTKRTLYFTFKGWRDLSKADPLFLELYNGKPEDYTFVTKLMGVGFTDGTTVGRTYMDFFDFEYDENGEIHFKD